MVEPRQASSRLHGESSTRHEQHVRQRQKRIYPKTVYSK